MLEMMLASQRVRQSTDILHTLGTNPHITDLEKADIGLALRNVGLDTVQIHAVLEPVEEVQGEDAPTAYEIENAAAIAAEEAAGKQFELMGPLEEDTTEPVAEIRMITPADAQATLAASVPAA